MLMCTTGRYCTNVWLFAHHHHNNPRRHHCYHSCGRQHHHHLYGQHHHRHSHHQHLHHQLIKVWHLLPLPTTAAALLPSWHPCQAENNIFLKLRLKSVGLPLHSYIYDTIAIIQSNYTNPEAIYMKNEFDFHPAPVPCFRCQFKLFCLAS